MNFSFTRYEHLLEQMGHVITKSSVKREPLGPSERLSVTLRYVFTGDSQVTLASKFRISSIFIITKNKLKFWTVIG